MYAVFVALRITQSHDPFSSWLFAGLLHFQASTRVIPEFIRILKLSRVWALGCSRAYTGFVFWDSGRMLNREKHGRWRPVKGSNYGLRV